MRLNTGGLAYGTITVGGVLAAESAARESYASTLEGAALALALYWLAHSYAELTRRRADGGEVLHLGALLDVVVHELSILAGAATPIVALILCWALGASLVHAVSAATWTAAGMVVVIEVAIGIRERLAPREFAAQAGFGVVIGLLVIGLRAVLH